MAKPHQPWPKSGTRRQLPFLLGSCLVVRPQRTIDTADLSHASLHTFRTRLSYALVRLPPRPSPAYCTLPQSLPSSLSTPLLAHILRLSPHIDRSPLARLATPPLATRTISLRSPNLAQPRTTSHNLAQPRTISLRSPNLAQSRTTSHNLAKYR